MKKSISRRSLLLALVIPLIAAAAPRPSEYLFVWAMEAEHPRASTQALMSPDLPAWRNNRGLGKDFLAVLDVRPGASFGTLVAMLPVGDSAMAHHTSRVGNRLAITGYGALATKVRFATLDRRTGKLTLEPGSIDFTRVWPDGWQGSAIPHGAVFNNPQR